MQGNVSVTFTSWPFTLSSLTEYAGKTAYSDCVAEGVAEADDVSVNV